MVSHFVTEKVMSSLSIFRFLGKEHPMIPSEVKREMKKLLKVISSLDMQILHFKSVFKRKIRLCDPFYFYFSRSKWEKMSSHASRCYKICFSFSIPMMMFFSLIIFVKYRSPHTITHIYKAHQTE